MKFFTSILGHMTTNFDVSKIDPDLLQQAAELIHNREGSSFVEVTQELSKSDGEDYHRVFGQIFKNWGVPHDMTYFDFRSWQCLHMAEFVRAAQEEQ